MCLASQLLSCQCGAVQIVQVFLTKEHVAIAMEYAHGGDLYQHVIARKPLYRLPEDQARWIFQQLLIGLDYCHKKVRLPIIPAQICGHFIAVPTKQTAQKEFVP